jgi:hypothetical protein
MSNTLSIRLPKELSQWVKQTAENTGLTQGEVVRQQLEKARSTAAGKPWMVLAGKARGPRDLSTREGFGKR